MLLYTKNEGQITRLVLDRSVFGSLSIVDLRLGSWLWFVIRSSLICYLWLWIRLSILMYMNHCWSLIYILRIIVTDDRRPLIYGCALELLIWILMVSFGFIVYWFVQIMVEFSWIGINIRPCLKFLQLGWLVLADCFLNFALSFCPMRSIGGGQLVLPNFAFLPRVSLSHLGKTRPRVFWTFWLHELSKGNPFIFHNGFQKYTRNLLALSFS